MPVKIDVEMLIDIISEENRTYYDYHIKAKNLYKGSYAGIGERRRELDDCYRSWSAQRGTVSDVCALLQLDKDAIGWLYKVARSVNRWREKNNWDKLIPDIMKEQIMRFVFGKFPVPSFTCAHCGLWGW